jgi:hypothetical protein
VSCKYMDSIDLHDPMFYAVLASKMLVSDGKLMNLMSYLRQCSSINCQRKRAYIDGTSDRENLHKCPLARAKKHTKIRKLCVPGNGAMAPAAFVRSC